MSIRTKILVTISVLFILLIGVNYAVQKSIILPSFIKLENREAGENLNRILSGIDRELSFLDQLCYDWASWNDTYEFVDKLSDDYIQGKLSKYTFTNIKLNFIYIFRNDGSVVWGQAFDLESESPLSFSFLKRQQLSTSHPMILSESGQSDETTRIRTGILDTEFGPMLFASRAIVHSDDSGPKKGVLTMGRLLTGEIVDSLREQTRINFDITYPLQTDALKKEKDTHESLNDNDLPYFVRKNAQEIRLLTFYNDVWGDAIFSISYRFPREITQKGLTSINYAVSLILGAALFVLLVLLLLLQTVVVKPLGKLTDHASRLEKEGDFSLRIDLERSDEVGQLANTIDIMVETIAERTNALMEANTKLKQMSLVDGLTGIANRRRFDEDMARKWRRMVRQNAPMSLILADIDLFKSYNDRYGHQKGDQCLVKVAKTINSEARRPADLVARYGGEEFAVILPDTDSEGALIVAERIRQTIQNVAIQHEGSEVADCITLSLGVSTIVPGLDDKMDEFIEQVDLMLYRAKKSGRNQTLGVTFPTKLKNPGNDQGNIFAIAPRL